MRVARARTALVSTILVVACRVAGATDTGVAPSLPVTVGLVNAHAYLRSGPGDDYYPTERLVRGAEVEVWAIDAAGWCAVRPVAGSFSWLRADDVERQGRDADGAADGGRGFTGVVVTDGAVARVGSQLNDLRHVTQVALEAGERVRVIEEVTVREGRHAGAWVRIEPPSGEFRWVPGEDLALPAGLVVAGEQPAADGIAAVGEAVAAIRDAGAAVSQAVAELEAEPSGRDPGGQPGLLPGGNALTRLVAGWLPRGTNVFDPPPAPAPTAVGAGAVAVPADELADIDLALSLAVTGSSGDWNLAPLRERLRLAAARANSPAERTRAQAIDARLARFETIQAGQRALAQGTPAAAEPVRIGGMWSSLAALGSRPIRPGVLPGGAPAGGQPTWTPPDQAETTGRLQTVISRRPEAPRWALVDDQNNVIVFVTPQPGVNLAPMVGQQVTVRGAKGFMPEYKRPYLVATEARPRLAATPPAMDERVQ